MKRDKAESNREGYKRFVEKQAGLCRKPKKMWVTTEEHEFLEWALKAFRGQIV
jgi:hypothetical protein